jgi:hypothetical protein
MSDARDIETKRKDAHDFIKNTLHLPPWHLPLDVSDEILADLIFGDAKSRYVSALSLLREGEKNPTEELVKYFKELCKNVIAESEINQNLVDPFI